MKKQCTERLKQNYKHQNGKSHTTTNKPGREVLPNHSPVGKVQEAEMHQLLSFPRTSHSLNPTHRAQKILHDVIPEISLLRIKAERTIKGRARRGKEKVNSKEKDISLGVQKRMRDFTCILENGKHMEIFVQGSQSL